MVTSPARRTPSLFTSSSTSSTAEVAATVIAFLLLTSSIGQTSCSPAQFHQRNISTIIDHNEPRLPTSTHSAAAANETLHHALLHRMVRQGSVTNTPTTKIACYSCTYIEEDGYIAGEECKDPFDKANNIPELMCPGWCHKLQKKLHQGGLMLVRGCSKTCEEKVDEHGYRHCCKSKQCNRSASLNSVNNSAFKIICSTLLCLFLAVRLNSFV